MFIEENRHPTVDKFNDNILERLLNQKKAVMLFFKDGEDEAFETFQKFAKNHKGQIIFSYVPKNHENNEIFEILDVHPHDLPQIRIMRLFQENIQKFKIEPITTANLEEKLTLFLEDELEEFFLSEEPQEQRYGKVIKVVGKTFEELIIRAQKPVCLLIHANWDEHSKSAMEEFKQVAERSDLDILFATIDATLNEHPLLSLRGFPEIRMYLSHQNPIVMENDPTRESIEDFIEKSLMPQEKTDL